MSAERVRPLTRQPAPAPTRGPFRATALEPVREPAREPLRTPTREPGPSQARVPRPPRLPGPIRRGRKRKEVALRPARPSDTAACALIDGSYLTSTIWQLDSRQDSDEIRVSFRQVRLPRDLALTTAHRPPVARAGALPRGLYWLVAEEIEVNPDGTPAAAEADAPWSHTLRRTGSASTVQLSLPPSESTAGRENGSVHPNRREAAPAAGGSSVVGYVVVATAPGEGNAYLRTLVVDAKYRRKGIAARLLGAAQRWAADQRAQELMADVAARNYPALRLLQKAGFTFCGFNDRCYPDNEVAVFFSCRLR